MKNEEKSASDARSLAQVRHFFLPLSFHYSLRLLYEKTHEIYEDFVLRMGVKWCLAMLTFFTGKTNQ